MRKLGEHLGLPQTSRARIEMAQYPRQRPLASRHLPKQWCLFFQDVCSTMTSCFSRHLQHDGIFLFKCCARVCLQITIAPQCKLVRATNYLDRSFFAKEPLIIRLFCAKRPIKIRHPMRLHHRVFQI